MDPPASPNQKTATISHACLCVAAFLHGLRWQSFKMKTITTTILVISTLASLFFSQSATSQNTIYRANARTETFSKCKLNVTFESSYIKFESKSNVDKDGCIIVFSPSKFDTAGSMEIILLITIAKNCEEKLKEAGFKQTNANSFIFTGYAFANSPYTFLNLSLKDEKNGDDTTLVGNEMVSARTQTGAPIILDGISILRMSPNFFVSTQIPFELDTPEDVRASVKSDLIKIVQSLQLTEDSDPHAPRM